MYPDTEEEYDRMNAFRDDEVRKSGKHGLICRMQWSLEYQKFESDCGNTIKVFVDIDDFNYCPFCGLILVKPI
jgi:hypothetical protein